MDPGNEAGWSDRNHLALLRSAVLFFPSPLMFSLLTLAEEGRREEEKKGSAVLISTCLGRREIPVWDSVCLLFC